MKRLILTKYKQAATALLFSLCVLSFQSTPAAADAPASIVQTAVQSGQTNTLVKLLQAADLVEAVSGPGPLTVLAPTDDAFAKLPPALVKQLLEPENKTKLQEILKYHVVAGKALAKDVAGQKELTSLAGPEIKVSKRDGSIYLIDSKVIAADIECTNGVIHLIDTVLLPPEDQDRKVSSNSPAQRCQRAMDLITLAVDRGVPLYNHGQHRACAAIYEIACHGLMMDLQSSCSACQGSCAKSTDVMQSAMRSIEEGMEKTEDQHSSKARAWTLRESMDDAYATLKGFSEPMTDDMSVSQK
jgi:transforming growth factor-beta-induced protein